MSIEERIKESRCRKAIATARRIKEEIISIEEKAVRSNWDNAQLNRLYRRLATAEKSAAFCCREHLLEELKDILAKKSQTERPKRKI